MSGERFRGFGEAVIDFYEGLEADNSKAYWTDNRTIYDEQVRAPMLDLLADLEPEFGRGKVFRPHRDLRFSPGRDPYKTQCGATAGAHYVQVSADGLMVATGYYAMVPTQVARYRAAVDDEHHGPELAKIVESVVGEGFTIGGQQLKTRPRGVSAEHPRLDLLRYRSLYAWCSWPPGDELHTPELAARVADAWRRTGPLAEWLNAHVGVDVDEG